MRWDLVNRDLRHEIATLRWANDAGPRGLSEFPGAKPG
jgi:hypothetical protein